VERPRRVSAKTNDPDGDLTLSQIAATVPV